MRSKSSRSKIPSPDDPGRVFAIRFRDLRLDLGLTQVSLGAIIEVPGTRVCDYECGRRLPDLHTLARIAMELDVSIDWLLGVSETPRVKKA